MRAGLLAAQVFRRLVVRGHAGSAGAQSHEVSRPSRVAAVAVRSAVRWWGGAGSGGSTGMAQLAGVGASPSLLQTATCRKLLYTVICNRGEMLQDLADLQGGGVMGSGSKRVSLWDDINKGNTRRLNNLAAP